MRQRYRVTEALNWELAEGQTLRGELSEIATLDSWLEDAPDGRWKITIFGDFFELIFFEEGSN